MEKHKIGNRGQLFIFPELDGEPTHIYTMIGEHYVFVVDTFLGASYIQPVLDYLKDFRETRKTVVINTHYDWDHIWGNSAFPHALFIAHESFSRELGLHFDEQLHQNQKYVRDDIAMPIPSITFSERISFLGEGIEIFHSPGHSADSISIFDAKDEVLIVGDNVEEPEPYENDVPRDIFLHTLKNYLKYPFRYLIAGHYWSEYDIVLRENIKRFE
jgi:hydroxyacylglutathione hydrolase